MRCLVLSLPMAIAACAHVEERSVEKSGGGPAEESYLRAYASSDVATYREARDAHAAWLEEHARAPEAREARVHYGKLLFALGEFDRAAEEFARVLEGAPIDYLGRGSARNAIVARLHAAHPEANAAELKPLKADGRVDRVTLSFEIAPIVLPDFDKGDDGRERDIAPAEQALADACDRYVEIAEATDPALPTFRLLAAEIYFRNRHSTEGAARCAEIVSRWPQSELSVSCVRATIDALNLHGKWADLERHARAFRSNLSLVGADHQLEAQLEQIVQVSSFKRIQSSVEGATASDPAVMRSMLITGAESFRAFQREFPYSDHADKALYNAFVYYARAERRPEAIEVGRQLVAQYGSSPLVPEIKKNLRTLDSSAGARAAR